ncbi:MAG TPA: hypothetical protein VHX59_07935, partial [Mycobacteriales bacterium]|nr:hypothetical protein [Mycobacteriales bacterium]
LYADTAPPINKAPTAAAATTYFTGTVVVPPEIGVRRGDRRADRKIRTCETVAGTLRAGGFAPVRQTRHGRIS